MADQGSEGLLSPWLRKRRFLAARPYIKGRVLDVGCGAGAFASMVAPSMYLGVEVDRESLELARQAYSSHSFLSHFPDVGEKFDTVISLAVIEHVSDIQGFLKKMAGYVKESDGQLVVTTPHPAMDWIHDLGAAVGLFSRHANEEHQQLLDRSGLERAGRSVGLRMVFYKRFLYGANQIAVFSPGDREVG